MEERRVFRRNYISSARKHKFIGGEIAKVLEKAESKIKIEVKGMPYEISYRDFIIVTKPIESVN